MPLLREATELGFDTETRPSFKKGEVHKVALLQLSTETDAFVFRLFAFNEYGPIKEIFENPAILKVGAAIRDDLRVLQARFKFEPKNFVELQDLAKKKNLENFGLKGMTEEVLGAKLSKGAKLTNWENPHLTEAQLMYAATDAWVGLMIYRKLKTLNPKPKTLSPKPRELKPETQKPASSKITPSRGADPQRSAGSESLKPTRPDTLAASEKSVPSGIWKSLLKAVFPTKGS